MEAPIKSDITVLSGIAKARAAVYKKIGINTVEDLLNHFPRDYLVLSNTTPIFSAPIDEPVVIKATVIKKERPHFVRKGLTLFKLSAGDGSGRMIITIFNAHYAFESLKIGTEYYFCGKLSGGLTFREMNSPVFYPVDGEEILPIYSLTEGLTEKMIQTNMRAALALCGEDFDEPIPDEIRENWNLCHIWFAMQNIHFPKDEKAFGEAKYRLAFQELLVLQLGLIRLRNKTRAITPIKLENIDISDFLKQLPFELTDGQKCAINDGLRDMQADFPMNRLVQGDVGSGKTMVSAALAFACHNNGYQTAIMAPTQILAEQHYRTFSTLLEPLGVKCCLLKGGGGVKKDELTAQIQDGEYSVIIGTHALVEDKVGFKALGLVVTDEQHRFGVAQRAKLSGKGENPHLLIMSATPIPRTLALIIYGDLDVSVISELPKGRIPIDTVVINSKKRGRALSFLKQEIDNGRQAYIVCPLIEQGESDLVSIETYSSELKKTPLGEYHIGILHGRLKAAEKEELMRDFCDNKINILISTTVVEVGVDVPNASIMMIENAERFGLSQLHQLRGRVGRGKYKSYCILVSDNQGDDNRERLKAMKENADGFAIAEIDLKLRGPGDFFGFKQHGLPPLRHANLYEDIELLNKTGELAKQILAGDSELTEEKNRGLARLVDNLFDQNEQGTMN